MSGPLSERLGRVAGPEGTAPDVDRLWARGRRSRRRSRAGRGLAVLAAVAVVTSGAVALAGGGGGDDVVAGPGLSVPAPPPQPTDLPVQMVVEAGPPVAGVPTLVAGDALAVSYRGEGGWIRGMSLDWEAWDGSSWSRTHTLVLGSGPEGSEGTVVPAGEDLLVPAAGMIGSGPDRFPTPDDVGPGWYRVCTDLAFEDVGAPITDGSEPVGTAPSSVGSVLDHPPPKAIRVCAQLRIVDPDGGPGPGGSTSAPPAEPDDLPVVLVPVPGAEVPVPARSGDVLAVGFSDGEDWTRGLAATWESWDGEAWTPTGGLSAARVEAGVVLPPSATAPDEGFGSDGVGFGLDGPAHYLVPAAPPGWHRVCVEVTRGAGAGGDRGDEGLSARPCLQVEVVAAPEGEQGEPPPGEDATWTLDPADGPGLAGGATTFTALVTRSGCAGGLTGTVHRPGVLVTGDDVIVTFTAAPMDGPARCPGNDVVPYEVDLGQALGHRRLLDGSCRLRAGGLSATCPSGDEERWPLA